MKSTLILTIFTIVLLNFFTQITSQALGCPRPRPNRCYATTPYRYVCGFDRWGRNRQTYVSSCFACINQWVGGYSYGRC